MRIPSSKNHRDSLLCSILDGVRASGNQCVCVRSTKSRRGLRIQPTSVPSSEEVESMHLRFLRQPPGKRLVSLLQLESYLLIRMSLFRGCFVLGGGRTLQCQCCLQRTSTCCQSGRELL